MASTPSAIAGRLVVRVRGGVTEGDEDEEDEGNTHEVWAQLQNREGGLDWRFLI